MTQPKVTVAMPVYNGSATVGRAISSILTQTFGDFELLIIDDGSEDASLECIRSFHDKRIRLIPHASNQGLAATRNHLLAESCGTYIAWLDCDDWSHPHRLSRQVETLESDPNLAICGTWVNVVESSPTSWIKRYIRRCFEHGPTSDADLRATLPFRNVFATSAVMQRRSTVIDNRLQFAEKYAPAEDYNMWTSTSHHGRMKVIPEVLVVRYEDSAGATATGWDRQMRAARVIREELLTDLGVDLTTTIRECHRTVAEITTCVPSAAASLNASRWLREFENWNKATGALDERALRRASIERFAFLVGYAIAAYPSQLPTLLAQSRYTWLLVPRLATRFTAAVCPWV